MDFFERQDIARKKTGRLIVLFAIAVVLIVCAMNLAAYGIMRVAEPYVRAQRDAAPVLRGDREYPGTLTRENRIWARPEPYIGVTLITLGIIACGSFYKMALLSRGGPAVAQMMGARPIDPDRYPEEKTLQNVVEEMSIASGVPVPQIFVMEEEDAINAFAAGFTTADAVVAVTRGCLTTLTRDELQGVIAHEFSHILNGDMRLNLRLIGILNGILVIALLGYGLLRSIPYMRSGRSDSDRKGNGAQIVLIMAFAGAALVVIGYVGLFFGRLIQAAVSRQREYLADASAVQFTRNPSGLAGALKKIAGMGSTLHTAHAIETAHLFFATGIKVGLTDLLATHPPIVERIKALDPMFDGQAATTTMPPALPRQDVVASGLAGTSQPPPIPAHAVVSAAGQASVRTVHKALEILLAIPDEIQNVAREPFGARVVALALLISDDESVRQKQLQAIQPLIDAATVEEAMRFAPGVERMNRTARVALLDLIQPALRRMSANQLRQFAGAVQAMIEADGRVTLFEYAMYRQLRREMSMADQSKRPAPPRYMSVQPLLNEITTVLSALAYRGKDPAVGAESFRAGMARLGVNEQILAASDYGLGALDPALNRLAEASPGVKRRIVDAAAHAIASDGVIQPDEAEILRALCAALDIPIPPLAA
ncbi:MAG: M48 family metallopeptidase [Anaerolineae bacterium]|nr:M48 family metallopeptidase [Phycisphaerae bacterium]